MILMQGKVRESLLKRHPVRDSSTSLSNRHFYTKLGLFLLGESLSSTLHTAAKRRNSSLSYFIKVTCLFLMIYYLNGKLNFILLQDLFFKRKIKVNLGKWYGRTRYFPPCPLVTIT